MNIIRSSLLGLMAATTALAEAPQFEIEARYEGFEPSFFGEVLPGAKKALPTGVLAAPRVTTKAGQKATIEIIREIVLPITGEGKAPSNEKVAYPTTSTNALGETVTTGNGGRTSTNCGVSLEVSPEMKDGQITLSGKSTVRRRLEPGAKQPLNAVSFATRETFFSDAVTDGQAVVIRVGDGLKDKSRITLTVKAIAAK